MPVPSTAIAVPMPWWRRALAWLVRAPSALPAEHEAGTDFAAGAAHRAGYDPAAAMSAYAAFPWVFAAVNAIAQDMQRVPVRLVRGEGKAGTRIESHPVLDLFARPASRVSGLQWHQQRIADRVLTGNAYTLLVGRGARPTSLLRLAPQRVEIVPAKDGQPDAYHFDGMGHQVVYPWDVVVHVRGVSWEDGPEGLHGQGLVRALHSYLTTDHNLWARAAESAKQGRPDAIVSPIDKDLGAWDKRAVQEIQRTIERIFGERHGGAAVIGHALKVEPIAWKSSDLGHVELHAAVRHAVLAASGVPGARLGLTDGVNYANAESQLRSYWSNTVMPLAAELDAADTQIAQRFDPALRIVRDFAAVPELQADRTARLARVRSWWQMGVPLPQAAAYEGFEDLPKFTPPDPADEEDEPEEESRARAVAEWLTASDEPQGGQRLAVLTRALDTEAERAAAWEDHIAEVHAPAEREILRAVRGYLEAARDRYIERAGRVLEDSRGSGATVVRISQQEMAQILAEIEERQALEVAVASRVRAAVRAAFEHAMRAVGLEIAWEPSRAVVPSLIARLVQQVSDATRDAVAHLITASLAEGESVHQIQARLHEAHAFSPARALAIARTETTRATSTGTESAYQAAADEGVDLQVEWLTARDEAVRETHRAMDGQRRPVGGAFQSPSGAKGPGPGNMGQADEDVNCRCALAPVLEEP